MKKICTIGLVLFVISYIMFSNSNLYISRPIDFAHWFNLIGAALLLFFNLVFPKNKIRKTGSLVTGIGVIGHIGLCTIDFIFWSLDNNPTLTSELKLHLSNTPSIVYPFIYIGPSMLFVGLSIHAFNFIKTNPLSSLMVILAAPMIGISYFVLQNGDYMLLSCIVFALGLGSLLYRDKIKQQAFNYL
ncbi:hypothetical protein [Xanthovirga aplysinae]|uniref:hypothetical protein n=1 Tax=Xanthovirga aplysinae TaxID=2529853 RepID=UPI001CA43594|nr:hypothetical protein [Xanthovirga aplysinae]